MVIKMLNFNHISTSLTEEDVKKFTDLWNGYREKVEWFKERYKRFMRWKLTLNMTSLALTTLGGVVGALTLNPIIIGVLSGVGLCIQGYVTKEKLDKKSRDYKFVFTSYEKVLNQIKTFLRGMPYDDAIFLSDVKVLDDIVTDLGLTGP